MKPDKYSQKVLSITRSKAKMYEYHVADEHHIDLPDDPSKLFRLSIGMLGDVAANGIGLENTPSADANFPAYFFDAYLNGKLEPELNDYLRVLGSASYYLGGLPGSSQVFASTIPADINIGGGGVEASIVWLLKGRGFRPRLPDNQYSHALTVLQASIDGYFRGETSVNQVMDATDRTRRIAYETGSPRELLLTDILGALVAKSLANSTRYALPGYSALTIDDWQTFLGKEHSIRELWPSQHLIGRSGILAGASGVVQMPTSAGKTRATELIIRSSFLSGRSAKAVVVAPYRALCHEIRQGLTDSFRGEKITVSEVTDVLQMDFDFGLIDETKHVVVLTPEKLLYALRQDPVPASGFGLVIFDEGHQFDSGTRGITYELLLTSLKRLIPPDAQRLLISAVVPNADSLGEWLNGPNSVVASSSGLLPTRRSIGFLSWTSELGRIEYVSDVQPDRGEFFVPRVLSAEPMNRLRNEKRQRIFPDRRDGKSIALALGLKLVEEGSVAIFCGTKAAARAVCGHVVQLLIRNFEFTSPKNFSNPREVERIAELYRLNLGESESSLAADAGVFTHHGDVPHGVRLAVEYAMRREQIRFVTCTSTLAQGVNLPIRYLIVTSMYQGGEELKVRDFHNLMGRAGRAGMHTEGSVLFADPEIYDQKDDWQNKWRWRRAKHLLAPINSEPCVSSLLSLFDPFRADGDGATLDEQISDFIALYIDARIGIDGLTKYYYGRYRDLVSEASLSAQIAEKVNLIDAIQSFLLANWDVGPAPMSAEDSVVLAKETLAFSLASEEKQQLILSLFQVLRENIERSVPQPERRRVFAKTILGIREAVEVEAWVNANLDELLAANESDVLLTTVWPILRSIARNRVLRKIEEPHQLVDTARQWIRGDSFHKMHRDLLKRGMRLRWGQRRFQKLKIEDVVHLCESGFGYECALLIAAIVEFVGSAMNMDSELAVDLTLLQKRVAYGLPTNRSVWLYELGFTDRVLAQELDSGLSLDDQNPIETLKRQDSEAAKILLRYPLYFRNRTRYL